MPEKYNKKRLSRIVVVLMIIAIAVVLWMPKQGQAQSLWDRLLGNEESAEEQLNEDDLATLISVYSQIKELYIEDVDKDILLEGALKGMVEATGDPYSEFLNAEQAQEMDEEVEGSFSGIGVQFMMQSDYPLVIAPIEGTPAAEAGIQPNDLILEADGNDLSGLNTNEIVQLIRGPIGSQVDLKLQRNDSTYEVTIERAEIPIITVEGEISEQDPRVGVIKFTQFNGTSYDEMVETVTRLREEGATSFVIDLRNNPGGLLDQALSISNMFLPEGVPLMQVQEGSDESQLTEYVADNDEYGDFVVEEPIAVLINQGSASASEIFAAAIKENTDWPVLGETSFGKGTVQTVLDQGDYGDLKITFAKWLTPKGEWIHEKGVEPTTEIEPAPIQTALLLNGEETLQIGMNNDYVDSLIAILDGLGYSVDDAEYFDESVKRAVEAFQKDKNIDVTGEVSGETADALNQAAREYLNDHDPQLEEAINLFTQIIDTEEQAA